MVVKSPVAMHIGLQTSGGFGESVPEFLDGSSCVCKTEAPGCQHYERAWGIYNANRGAERPDRPLEALQPALKKADGGRAPG